MRCNFASWKCVVAFALSVSCHDLVHQTTLTRICDSIGGIAGSLGEHVHLSPEGKPEYTAHTVIFMKVNRVDDRR